MTGAATRGIEHHFSLFKIPVNKFPFYQWQCLFHSPSPSRTFRLRSADEFVSRLAQQLLTRTRLIMFQLTLRNMVQRFLPCFIDKAHIAHASFITEGIFKPFKVFVVHLRGPT